MKRKIISLILCICMVSMLYMPTVLKVSAENESANIISNNTSLTKVEGLETKKEVLPNDDGSYTVTLNSFTTGEVSSSEISVPVDIALVLDVSGSMDDYIVAGYGKEYIEHLNKEYGVTEGTYKVEFVRRMMSEKYELRYKDGEWQYKNFFNDWISLSDTNYKIEKIYIRKIDALKISVNNFIDSVYEKSLGKDGILNSEDDINYRVSIIKFAGERRDKYGDDKYEDGRHTYNYSQIVKDFTSVGGEKDKIKNIISGLSTGGATSADYGMELARDLFNKNPDAENSKKVTILFTDGEPNHGNGFDKDVANAAIGAAGDLKSSGISVYTVGIFDGADCTVPMTNNADVMNQYMHYLSSNFPNAKSMQTCGDASYPDFGSYYLSANTSDGLNNVFETISQSIVSPSLSLSSETVIKDIVSDYFTFQANMTPSDIKMYTQDFKGGNSYSDYNWEERVPFNSGEISILDKEITVTGFDFDDNCVTVQDKSHGGLDYGRKLVIEFKIWPKAGFIGGNNIPTNGVNSGIYLGDTLIENFDLPQVDIPINYSFDTAIQKIYITDEADLRASLKESNKLDGKNNQFVDIEYTFRNKDIVAKYRVPAGATEGVWTNSKVSPLQTEKYFVECNVIPSTNGSITAARLDDKTAIIYVFKPYVSVSDSKANYNEEVDLNNNVDNVSWKCIELPEDETPLTAAPQISCDYKNIDLDESIPNNDSTIMKADTNFKISSVFVNGIDIVENTTFNNNGVFKITLNRFDLNIIKTVDDSIIDQNFIINVKDSEGNVYPVTITPNDFITGKAKKTIKGLYCGMKYEVAEDQNWSWRFTPNKEKEEIISMIDGETVKLEITNVRTKTDWFAAEAIVRNESMDSIWNRIANSLTSIIK